MLRNCTKENYVITGGFAKMISYFTKTHNSGLYSFVDCDWVSLKEPSYKRVGFVLEKHTSPGYHWTSGSTRENRLNYTKQKLIDKGYDKNKTENEIMKENGFYKIWGSGNLKFAYDNGQKDPI